jgi:DNA-directed RNA polymerase specialized sigma24 family protein
MKNYATNGLAGDAKSLRQQVRALWTDGYDTAEMARVLNVPEHECERHLHWALLTRRAIVNSLCGND